MPAASRLKARSGRMKTRNTCTSDCGNRRQALCRRGCSVVFSRVTLFPPCGHQSDAVQSGAASASAERVISGRRIGDCSISRAYGGRPVKAYRRDGRRHLNAGGGWQDRLCCSLRCGMYLHRQAIGAVIDDICFQRRADVPH